MGHESGSLIFQPDLNEILSNLKGKSQIRVEQPSLWTCREEEVSGATGPET